MKKRKSELGKGNVITIASRSELAKLPKRLRDVVPARMLDLWEGAPSSINALAKHAESPAFARWLRHAAKATCSLEIYDVKGLDTRAYLSFDLGLSDTPVPMPWTVLVDCLTSPIPKGCPPALRNVYALIGGLCNQVGGVDLLIPPPDLEPASRMGEIRAHLEPLPPYDLADSEAAWEAMEDMERRMKAARTEKWWKALDLGFDVTALVPFYCTGGGDYLAYDREGNARWIGNEDGDPDAFPGLTVASSVEHLFTTLASRKRFDMGEQQELMTRGRKRSQR